MNSAVARETLRRFCERNIVRGNRLLLAGLDPIVLEELVTIYNAVTLEFVDKNVPEDRRGRVVAPEEFGARRPGCV